MKRRKICFETIRNWYRKKRQRSRRQCSNKSQALWWGGGGATMQLGSTKTTWGVVWLLKVMVAELPLSTKFENRWSLTARGLHRASWCFRDESVQVNSMSISGSFFSLFEICWISVIINTYFYDFCLWREEDKGRGVNLSWRDNGRNSLKFLKFGKLLKVFKVITLLNTLNLYDSYIKESKRLTKTWIENKVCS